MKYKWLLFDADGTLFDYDKAEEYALKAIEVNPNYYVSYSLLGEIQMEQDRCSEAIDYFNTAIELNDSYVTGYLNRGACFFKQENLSDAEEDFKKALEIYPDYKTAKRNLGMVYAATGQFEEAIGQLEDVISGLDDIEAMYLLGVSLINTGKTDQGTRYLEQVLAIEPGYQPAINTLNQLTN